MEVEKVSVVDAGHRVTKSLAHALGTLTNQHFSDPGENEDISQYFGAEADIYVVSKPEYRALFQAVIRSLCSEEAKETVEQVYSTRQRMSCP